MNNITPEQKKRRFRELAQHDWRIRTARELAEELEQPYLPLFNDCLTDVRRTKAACARGILSYPPNNKTHPAPS
jgi:hypothetical protein